MHWIYASRKCRFLCGFLPDAKLVIFASAAVIIALAAEDSECLTPTSMRMNQEKSPLRRRLRSLSHSTNEVRTAQPTPAWQTEHTKSQNQVGPSWAYTSFRNGNDSPIRIKVDDLLKSDDTTDDAIFVSFASRTRKTDGEGNGR